jgi:hypothetical protein
MEGIEKRERDEHSHERICMYTYDGRQRTNEGRLEEERESERHYNDREKCRPYHAYKQQQ